MTSLLEFNARAALCRHFAILEPDSRYVWLAEAERWARLTEYEDEPETPRYRDAGMSALGFVKPGGN
jgi:hypothetical protein